MPNGLELLFAAYDPALRSVDGQYWAWASARIPQNLLDEAHAMTSRHDHCDRPNSLGANDLWGGFISLSPEWCVFYRYYNGGRDLVGRPERGIVLFAFTQWSDATRHDCSSLWDQRPFSDWTQKQPLAACIEPVGNVGELFVTLPPTLSVPIGSVGSSSLPRIFSGDDLQQWWPSVCRLGRSERFLVKYHRQDGKTHGEFAVLSHPGPKDPASASMPIASPSRRSGPSDLTASDRFTSGGRHFPFGIIGISFIMGALIGGSVGWHLGLRQLEQNNWSQEPTTRSQQKELSTSEQSRNELHLNDQAGQGPDDHEKN